MMVDRLNNKLILPILRICGVYFALAFVVLFALAWQHGEPVRGIPTLALLAALWNLIAVTVNAPVLVRSFRSLEQKSLSVEDVEYRAILAAALALVATILALVVILTEWATWSTYLQEPWRLISAATGVIATWAQVVIWYGLILRAREQRRVMRYGAAGS